MDARAKVYRNIDRRQELLGLEPPDLFLLGAVAALLMSVYGDAPGWDLLIVVTGWVALRLVKRGKPDGYTSSLVRFYLLRKPFFSAAARDTQVPRHPFGGGS